MEPRRFDRHFCRLFDGRAAAENDEIGERDHLAA
jgi:hypothetical protein